MLSSVQNAPLDRLGGLDTLERGVAILFTRLKATPELMPLLPSGADNDSSDAEWQLQLWLTDILGGPMRYDGPDVKFLFHQEQAGPDLWSRFGGLIGDSLQATEATPSAVYEARQLIDAALAAASGAAASSARIASAAAAAAQARPSFAVAWGDEPDFPIAWRDDAEAQRRTAIIARLKLEAEALPTPTMFPDAKGELWFGNAACTHAVARLGAWLPDDFDPAQGIPATLFFPDVTERQALFSNLNTLPFTKRVCYGPDTVTLVVSAVHDEQHRILCPQISWEVFNTMVPLEMLDQPAAPAVAAPHPVPPRPMPEMAPIAHQAPASAGLNETATNLKLEARAIEQSAQALLGLTRLLDSLADRAAGQSSNAPVASLAAAVADADGATRLIEQGLAAIAAAREVSGGPGRSPEISGALDHLMELARRTNQLVLDASLRAVEDDVAGAANALLARTGAVRSGLAAQVNGLTVEAQAVAQQLEKGAATAGRFAELREAMRGPAA